MAFLSLAAVVDARGLSTPLAPALPVAVVGRRTFLTDVVRTAADAFMAEDV